MIDWVLDKAHEWLWDGWGGGWGESEVQMRDTDHLTLAKPTLVPLYGIALHKITHTLKQYRWKNPLTGPCRAPFEAEKNVIFISTFH